jgi:hypothetical protein
MDGEAQDIDFGQYGFGTVRTVKDYERYAGISFKKRAVQKYTLDQHYPPNPHYDTDEKFEASFLTIFKHCIDIGFHEVPEQDYDFWVVAFHDEAGTTMFRQDVNESEIKNYLADTGGYCKIWREFQAEKLPAYWVVWPHSKSKGWCDRIQRNLK